MTGRFIVFEGIDTEVLSNQAELLADWFRVEAGVKSVVMTREPTDGPLGFQMRLVLNNRIDLHDYAQSLLSVSDRMDHFFGTGKEEDNSISNDLHKGAYVLSSGYLLADYVYKSEAISLDWLIRINCFFPWPDLMIFIDMPVDSILIKFIKEHGYDESDVRIKREELIGLRSNYLEVISTLREQGHKIEIIESDSTEIIYRNCVKLVQNTAAWMET